jgi:hypothetical protein
MISDAHKFIFVHINKTGAQWLSVDACERKPGCLE